MIGFGKVIGGERKKREKKTKNHRKQLSGENFHKPRRSSIHADSFAEMLKIITVKIPNERDGNGQEGLKRKNQKEKNIFECLGPGRTPPPADFRSPRSRN